MGDLYSFNNLVWAWTIIGAIVFIVLLFITAPYGRHSTKSWGPMISNRLGWVLMELPSLLAFSLFLWLGPVKKDTVIILLFVLWAIHYVNRSLIFPFRTKTSGKKMPVVIALSAVFFNLINGGLNGYYLGFLTKGYDNSWLTDPRFIIGFIVFYSGFMINQVADRKLLALRSKGADTSYKVPRGWLFEYISCPNFFGEMIEWSGFALMAWNLPALSFLLWTVFNLIPRALSHHKWYKEKFADYPKGRKAVIPFVL